MDNLFDLVQEINGQIKDQKLSTLTVHDEHMLLRTVSTLLLQAHNEGRIDVIPSFHLDADKEGSMMVKLGEVVP